MNATTISVMELRDRVGDTLNRVSYAGERFIIERRGKPVAAIISIELLELLEHMELEREAELIRLARAAAESEGVVPFEDLVKQYEDLHGEDLELSLNA
jgi:prevent-host-death family protein